MESHSDSIVAVSEPFEEEFEANASGSIEAEKVQANGDEESLSFKFKIAVAFVQDNSNVVENEFTEAVGEIESRN